MNINQIFSTPIWDMQLPDFNDYKSQMLDAVYDFQTSYPEGNHLSNIGGYQSPINFTADPRLAPLYEFVCQMATKANFDMQFVDCDVYLSAAWVNINSSRSASNFYHVHQDTYSGVFYLQTPEQSGKLVISNPGINPLWQGAMLPDIKNKFNCEKLRIEPKEGHILLWPSFLPHWVEPNNHDDSRISISFNVVCIPKENIPHTK